MKKRKHNVYAFPIEGEFEGTQWVATDDSEDEKFAYGPTEDYAIAQWWALYAIDEKYPHRGEDGYINPERIVNS